jgi:hypothetical protein
MIILIMMITCLEIPLCEKLNEEHIFLVYIVTNLEFLN